MKRMRWKIDIPLILWLRRRNTPKKKEKTKRTRIAPECFVYDVYVCFVSFVVSCCFFWRCVFSGDSGSQIYKNPMNQKQPRNNLRLSAVHIHVPFLFICVFLVSFSFVAKTRCKLNWDPKSLETKGQKSANHSVAMYLFLLDSLLFFFLPFLRESIDYRCGATESPQRNNNTTKNTEKTQKRNKTQIYKALWRDLFIFDVIVCLVCFRIVSFLLFACFFVVFCFFVASILFLHEHVLVLLCLSVLFFLP